MITAENYSSSFYQSGQLKAFISFGGGPDEGEDVKFLYFVTVTDMDHKEQFQKSFSQETLAISYINGRYGHWELIDARQASTGGGCGSCAAH